MSRPGSILSLLLALLVLVPVAVWAVPPSITSNPVSVNATTSTSIVTFTAGASGSPPLTFQWRLNGVNIPGTLHTKATGLTNVTDTLTLQGVGVEDGGAYSVVVFNGEGAASSAIAFLNITNLPVLPVSDSFAGRQQLPTTLNGAHGRTNNLNASPEAFEPLIGGKPGKHSVWLTWKAPETGIVTFDTAGSSFDTTLSIFTGTGLTSLGLVGRDDDHGGFLRSKVTFNATANTLYVIGIDGFYETAGNLCLRWAETPTSDVIPTVTSQTDDKTVQPGSDVTFAVQLNPLANTFDEYQWYRDGQPLNGQVDTSLTIVNVTSNKVGNYVLEVISTGQGARYTNYSDTIQLQINVTDNTSFNGGAYAQSKFRNASDNGIGVLVAAPASGYSGSQIFSTYGAVKEPGEPNHCGEAGGASYWFSYQSPANGVLTADALAGFNNLLAVYTGPNATNFNSLTSVACATTNGGSGHEVTVFNVTNGTTYYLVSDGVGGASGTINLSYALTAPPSVTGAPGSLTVNPTSNASFSISAVGTPALKYQWRHNVTNNVLNATNASLTLTNCQSTNAGNYTCVVTNTYGSTTSSPATLTVRTPIVISNQPATTSALQGSIAQFAVVAGGTTPTYQWRFFVTNNLPGATNATLSLTNVQPTNAGDYTVVITNAVNALTSTVATLTVNVPPTITNQPASQTVVQSSNVSLTVGASGSTPLSYQWRTNGNVFNGRTANPLTLTNFQGTNEASYTVVVTNNYGAVTSSSAFLYLIPSNAASRFTNWSYPTNKFAVTLLGSPNSNYAVLVSTNTTNWTAISTNSSVTGIIPLTVTNSQGYTNLLFRARTP